MLTDSHCHLYHEYYEDIDLIINNSIDNNVGSWINNGCNDKTNKEVIALVNKYTNMYGAIGIHPEEVLNYQDSDLQFLIDNINSSKIIAIGEIGLDYHYGIDNKDKQIELLEKELKIAEKYNKPVIIHSRDAFTDTINILKKYQVKGVIHSFSGSLDNALEYMKMGYLIGVNGIITFKNSEIVDVIKKIPLDKIILETDSPYLTPVPFRGKQNEPKYIKEIVEFIAKLKNVSIEEVIKITNQNINKLFKIKC